MSYTLSERDVGRIARALRAFENERGDGGGSAFGSPGLIFQFALFRVKSVSDDYVVGRILDDAATQNEGTVDIKIAKPNVLRKTPYHGKVITFNGSALTFSYTNSTTRTVTKNGIPETQIIIPAYTGTGTGYVGEIIVAATGLPTGVRLNAGQSNEESLVWLDLNFDGRMWAKQ